MVPISQHLAGDAEDLGADRGPDPREPLQDLAAVCHGMPN
jgi:hypothetical protein